jgi:hypothetical protein
MWRVEARPQGKLQAERITELVIDGLAAP